MMECPVCGSKDIVNHQDPMEEKYHVEHWYCRKCKSDW